MSKKKPPTPSEGALFVRLPASAVEKLHRAADAMGMRKKDLVASLVSKYVDPDSPRGLSALGSLSARPLGMTPSSGDSSRGSYSFQPYDLPEVMTAEQAADFLQIEAVALIEMAEARQLPGRKLAAGWRFSRAALVAWLSSTAKP